MTKKCLHGANIAEIVERAEALQDYECPYCVIEQLHAAVKTAQELAATRLKEIERLRKQLTDCEQLLAAHDPKRECGYWMRTSPPEPLPAPTDSELYDSSPIFRHIWTCPIGWIGERLVYGPGYTLEDMKPWLIELRRLAGFEKPEGTVNTLKSGGSHAE